MSEGNVTDASSALSVRVPKDTVGNASLDGDSPPSTGAEMSESYKQACLESATKEIETSEMIATAEASFEHAMKANDGKTAIEARSRILTGKKLSLYYYVNKAENGLAYKIYELSANASDPAGSDNTSAQQSTTTGSTGARGRNGYAIEVLPQVSQSQGRKHGSRGSSRKSTGATHGFERHKVISDYWPWPDTEAAKSAKKKYEATWDNTMDSVYDAKRQMDEQGVRHFKIGVDVLVSLQAAKGLDPGTLAFSDNAGLC